MLNLERLEGRDCPATLNVVGGALTFSDGGGENNTLTVQYNAGSYAFNDSAAVISLGGGAVAAGWRGGGTHAVSGPGAAVDSIAIDIGGGTNVVNLRQINDATTIDGGGGTTTINVNSFAPFMVGNLSGIAADLDVTAGTDTTLNVSDQAGATRASTVEITSSGITGLSPHAIAYSGTFASFVVSGSNVGSLAESFDVNSPPADYFRLNTNGGNDTVTVSGDVTGDFYLGGGDDSLTVLEGFILAGSVHAGGQAGDQVFYGEPTYGTITGSVGA